MSNFEDVKIFMKAFGQMIRTEPQFPDDKTMQLRFDLIKEELSEFQKKYPGIDVNQSYNKFLLNMKEKGKVIDDLAAAFEIWLMNDVKYDYNKRDKSNDLVTRYCVKCDKPKKVKKGNEERNAICCGEQMWSRNEYFHEKSRMKEKDKKVK